MRFTLLISFVFWAGSSARLLFANDIAEMVAAHEATMSRINSASVAVRHQSQRGGNAPVAIHLDHWWKDGDKERFKRLTTIDFPNGRQQQTLDQIGLDFSTRKMLRLRVHGAEVPKQVSPRNQGGMAYQAPFQRNLLEFQIYGYFNFRIAYNASDQWRTLRELIDESEKAAIVGQPKIGEHKCIEVEVAHPGVDEDSKGSPLFVAVDPSAGFLVRRVRIPRVGPNGEESETRYNITEFKDFGDGIFFPMKSEVYVWQDGARFGHNRFQVDKIQLNKPISASEVSLQFPKGLLVNDFTQPVSSSVPARQTDVLLIGENGEVERRFSAGSSELQAYIKSHNGGPLPRQYLAYVVGFAAMLLAAIVITGRILLLRARRS